MALLFNKESRSGLKLVSAPFGFSLLLLAVPLSLMVLLSFWTQDYLTLDRTLTLNNYREIGSHPVYALLMKRSVIISLMVTTITVALAFPMVNRFIAAAGKIPFAPTLGDVATTLSHPASSSHRALSAEARAALGMSEGFFRLSVGIEPAALLLGELNAALAAVNGE